MADTKLSALPELATTPATDDEVYIRDVSVASGLESKRITMANLLGDVVRSATLVVAASDSPTKSKAQADYVCDGTADDVQIQAAIDALPAAGGTVKLSEGTFTIAIGQTYGTADCGVVVDRSDVTLSGEGDSTVIDFSGIAGYGLWVGKTGVQAEAGQRFYRNVVRNMRFIGDGTDNENHLVYVFGMADVKVLNCSFYQSGDEALIIQLSEDFIVDGNVFEDCSGADAAGGEFYTESTVKRGTISNNHFLDSAGRTLLYIYQSTSRVNEETEYIIVTGNHFYGGAYSFQIGAANVAGALTRRVIVTGNTFNGATSGTIALAGVGLGRIRNCIISHNIIHDTPVGVRLLGWEAQDTIITENQFISATTPIDDSGTRSRIFLNVGYIHHGECRASSDPLSSGNANAIALSWNNPESQDVLIKKVVIEVTTAGGTVGSHLDVGIADDAVGTNRGTEFFNDLDLNAVQINDSWVAGDGGTQTKWVFCQDIYSATDDWIVGQILDANAASLVGKYYIEYVGR